MNNTDTIRLGILSPLSGLVELYGEEISRAAKIAEQEINQQGGLLGCPFEVVIEDDGSLPETAVPAAYNLVTKKKCVAIIGNLLSNSRIAVANQVADRLKVPYLNFSFYEGSISSRYFFHFAALPNQQIDKMIPYMAEKYGPKFFFAGSNYEWPLGSIDAAKHSLMNYGGEVVGEEYLPIGSEAIEILLDKVKKSGADVFVPYFAGLDQVNLLTGFTDIGLKERVAVVMGHYDEAMVSNLSPKVRNGFYSSNTYFMSVDTLENMQMLESLGKYPGVTGVWPKGNGILTNFGEGTYLCVKAFAAAVKKAESLDPEKLVDALSHINISGPQGHVTMDPITHHARINSYLAKCDTDGWFSIIKQFGEIDPIIPLRYRVEVDLKKLNAFTPSHERDKQSNSNELPQPSLLPQNHSAELFLSTQSAAEQILAITDIAIVAIDETGKIVYVNKNTIELFNYSEEELINKPLTILLPPRFHQTHMRNVDVFKDSDDTDRRMNRRGVIYGYKKNGEEFPAQASISKIITHNSMLMVASLRDVSEQKHMEDELIWKATHDPLTKLPNRVLIKDRISTALFRSLRTLNEIFLLFIDLDEFKLINDTYGHDIGDQLLIEVSERLVNSVRPGDTVARFGGDEFVVLCEQIDQHDIAFNIASRIITNLQQPILINQSKLFISGSIGIAFGDGNFYTAEDLLKNADIAMYEAKIKGKNNWSIFSTELEESRKLELFIADGLRSALVKNELKAYYQPIFDISGKKIIGAELLTRWYHQDDIISPSVFIPVAEKTGTIIQLGYWALREGCIFQQKLYNFIKDYGLAIDLPFLSINVSIKQLDDIDFVKNIQTIVDETHIDPSKLILEITESTLMTNIDDNIKILNSLKQIGLSTAVDDFGTGYSSLNYLSKMPVSKIKIDKSFIDDFVEKPQQRTIVSAIIMMARAMNLDVVAEGVETINQLQVLEELGCHEIQGYIFSRPIKPDDFIKLLESLGKNQIL